MVNISISSSKVKSTLPVDLQLLLIPVTLLIVLFILFLFLFKVGFGQLTKQNKEMVKIKKDIQILEKRSEVLQKVGAELAENSQFFATIFPEENASLIVFSQLKNLAVSSGLIASNFRAGASKAEGDLEKTTVSFNLFGDISSIINYCQTLKEVAPIMVLDRIKYGEAEGGMEASISVSTFWSKTLTKLPAVTEPVSDLTSEEQDIILEVVNLTQPTFIEVPATGPTGRTDPF